MASGSEIGVVSWSDLAAAAPDFAARVQHRLDAHVHKTLATLRADGSPRISGIETFIVDGELWVGSMPGARKAADLRRDPRFALHSGSADPPGWEGDAKLSGRAAEVTDPARRREVFGRRSGDPPPAPEAADLFRLGIAEAVLVSLNAARDRLVIELWRPGRPVVRTERA